MKLRDLVANSLPRVRAKKKKVTVPAGASSGESSSKPEVRSGSSSLEVSANKPQVVATKRASRDDGLELGGTPEVSWRGNALYRGLEAARAVKLNSKMMSTSYTSSHGMVTSHSAEGFTSQLMMMSRSYDSRIGVPDWSDTRIIVPECNDSCPQISSFSESCVEPHAYPQQYYHCHYHRHNHHHYHHHHLHAKPMAQVVQNQQQQQFCSHASDGKNLASCKVPQEVKAETGFFRKSLASLGGIRKGSSKSKKAGKQGADDKTLCSVCPYPETGSAASTKGQASDKRPTKPKRKNFKGFSKLKENKEFVFFGDKWDSTWFSDNDCRSAPRRPHINRDDMTGFATLDKCNLRERSVESCSSCLFGSRESSVVREVDFPGFDSASLSGYESDLPRGKVHRSRSRIKTNPWLPSPQPPVAGETRGQHCDFHESREDIVATDEFISRLPRSASFEYQRKTSMPSQISSQNHSVPDKTLVQRPRSLTPSETKVTFSLNPQVKGDVSPTWWSSSEDCAGLRGAVGLKLNDLNSDAPKCRPTCTISPNSEFILLTDNLEQLASNISFEYEETLDTTLESVSICQEDDQASIHELLTDEENGNVATKIFVKSDGDAHNAHSPDSGIGGIGSTDGDDALTPSAQRGHNSMSECLEASSRMVSTDMEASGRMITTDMEASGRMITTDMEASGRMITTDIEESGRMITTDTEASGRMVITDNVSEIDPNLEMSIFSHARKEQNHNRKKPSVESKRFPVTISYPQRMNDVPVSCSYDTRSSFCCNTKHISLHDERCELELDISANLSESDVDNTSYQDSGGFSFAHTDNPMFRDVSNKHLQYNHHKCDNKCVDVTKPGRNMFNYQNEDFLLDVSKQELVQSRTNTTLMVNERLDIQVAPNHRQFLGSGLVMGSMARKHEKTLGGFTKHISGNVGGASAVVGSRNVRPMAFRTSPRGQHLTGMMNDIEKGSGLVQVSRPWSSEYDFPRNITLTECAESPTENWRCDEQFSSCCNQQEEAVICCNQQEEAVICCNQQEEAVNRCNQQEKAVICCNQQEEVVNRCSQHEEVVNRCSQHEEVLSPSDSGHCSQGGERLQDVELRGKGPVFIKNEELVVRIHDCATACINNEKLAVGVNDFVRETSTRKKQVTENKRHCVANHEISCENAMSDACVQTDFDDDFSKWDDADSLESLEDRSVDLTESTRVWLLTGNMQGSADTGYSSLTRDSLVFMDEDSLLMAGEVAAAERLSCGESFKQDNSGSMAHFGSACLKAIPHQFSDYADTPAQMEAHQVITVNGAQQTVNGAQQTVNGAQKTVNGAQQTVNGAQQAANSAQQTATGAQQIANGAQQIFSENITLHKTNLGAESQSRDHHVKTCTGKKVYNCARADHSILQTSSDSQLRTNQSCHGDNARAFTTRSSSESSDQTLKFSDSDDLECDITTAKTSTIKDSETGEMKVSVRPNGCSLSSSDYIHSPSEYPLRKGTLSQGQCQVQNTGFLNYTRSQKESPFSLSGSDLCAVTDLGHCSEVLPSSIVPGCERADYLEFLKDAPLNRSHLKRPLFLVPGLGPVDMSCSEQINLFAQTGTSNLKSELPNNPTVCTSWTPTVSPSTTHCGKKLKYKKGDYALTANEQHSRYVAPPTNNTHISLQARHGQPLAQSLGLQQVESARSAPTSCGQTALIKVPLYLIHNQGFKDVSTANVSHHTPSLSSQPTTTMTATASERSLEERKRKEEATKSLRDRVMSLRREKDVVFQKIREARLDDRNREEQRLQVQGHLRAHRKEVLLETLHELRKRVEEESKVLKMSESARGQP